MALARHLGNGIVQKCNSASCQNEKKYVITFKKYMMYIYIYIGNDLRGRVNPGLQSNSIHKKLQSCSHHVAPEIIIIYSIIVETSTIQNILRILHHRIVENN